MFLAIDALLVAAIMTNGLLAGLFFVFACAITPGFRDVDDATYVQAFQAINRTILNGWFLLVFFTAPLTAVVYPVLGVRQMHSVSPWLAGVGAICAVLTFLITAAGNVPQNNRLGRSAASNPTNFQAARRGFENRWNRWNLARTLTSTGALSSLTIVGVIG